MNVSTVFNGMTDKELDFGQLEAANGGLDLFSLVTKKCAVLVFAADAEVGTVNDKAADSDCYFTEGCDLLHLVTCG